MSTTRSPFLKVQIGADLVPDSSNGQLGGNVRVGRKIEHTESTGGAAWECRLLFGAATQTATINLGTGEITLSATGARQEESYPVTAAAGCTAKGSLPVTVTGAGITGSPLLVLVPLTPSRHPTEEKIAAAIAASLAATPAIAALYESLPPEPGRRSGRLRRWRGAANDGTLNVAIAAGLGVSAAATSVNVRNGAVGVVVERQGADGENALGEVLDSPNAIQQKILLQADPANAGVFVVQVEATRYFPNMGAGNFIAASLDGLSDDPMVITANGADIMDLVFLSK
jgi:hypothetical protein